MYQKARNNTDCEDLNFDKKVMSTSPCPARKFIDILKGKFSVEILEQIVEGNLHYGKLLRAIPAINPRILSARLREFEKAGILVRTVFPTVPPQVEYTLTEKGEALKTVFTPIKEWVDDFD